MPDSGSQLIQLYPLREGTLIVFDKQADYEAILATLQQMIDDRRGRFPGGSLIVDVGPRQLSTRQLLELEELINRYLGTRVLQIVNDEAQEILREEGWTPPPASPVRSAMKSEASPRGPDAPAAAPLSPPRFEPAHLLHRTVRSGQRVTCEGSIVILGDVNPGAEVVATGNVVVVGTLRGIAHAGARGDSGRCILALRLRPVQIRIAHLIGRAPDEAAGGDEPEVAYVRDGQIVVEALSARAEMALAQGGSAPWAKRS
ncbi:MAG TPA: septum site-determining protein MinC [Bacillota bacterium]